MPFGHVCTSAPLVLTIPQGSRGPLLSPFHKSENRRPNKLLKRNGATDLAMCCVSSTLCNYYVIILISPFDL